MTEYYRVHGIRKAEMTEYYRVRGIPKAETTGTRRYLHSDDLLYIRSSRSGGYL